MLCVSIRGPSLEQARRQIEEAQKYAQIVEWRLDYFETLEFSKLSELKSAFPLQTIFTLRPKTQGGKYQHDEEKRLQKIEELAHLTPSFIDLEYTVPPEFIQNLKRHHPQIKMILSFHDFERVPYPLDDLIHSLQAVDADYYKIAVRAHSSLDTLKVLLFAKEARENILVMTMGETGPLSRILAPIAKRPFTYASLNQDLTTAPGQVSAKDLIETYHYNSLKPTTGIYGLIGNPIDKSPSHRTHNEVMKQLSLDSVYVKIPLKPDELKEFFTLFKNLGIRGLSVTMPLKELISDYLDEIDLQAQEIGAINTISLENGKIKGYNTDSVGALDAIKNHLPVKGKKMIILGAGGASKALAWEAIRRGAHVVILNRHAQKAHDLAEKLGCEGGGLEEISRSAGRGYDIIINATPDSLPIDPQWLIPNTVAMDLTTFPQKTQFLAEAQKRQCKLIYGYEMFVNQAIAQFKIWFPSVDSEQVKKIMLSHFISKA